jgi:hypothetical protein
MNNFKTFFNEAKTVNPNQPELIQNFQYQAKQTITNIINLKKLSKQEGGFCVWQPKIQEFALKSPENMAITLIFPIATQLKDWGEVSRHFGDLVTHLRSRNNLQFTQEERKIIRWKGLAYVGREGIEYIWQNRKQLFNKIKPLIDTNNSFELYQFLASHVPKLGVVKAGFAVQLLTGKLGCIDSVNTRFLNIPPEILNPTTGKIISSVKGFIDKKTNELNEKGLRILKSYEQFLKTLQRYKGDDESRQLWDTWCSIIGIRALTAGEKDSRFAFKAGSYSGNIPTYKSTPAINDLRKRLLQAVKLGGGKITYNPDKVTIKTIDNKALKIISNIISRDHYELMMRVMGIPQKEIKKLNKQYLNPPQDPKLFENTNQPQNNQQEQQALNKLRRYILKILNFRNEKVPAENNQ